MDINALRIVVTVLSLVIFVGIVYWAYSSGRRARFEEAANLPFAESDLPPQSSTESKDHTNGVRS